MSLNVLITGRLVKPAQERTGNSGKTFALTQINVPTEGDESLLASCIAFNRTTINALLALDKGDAVALAGKARLSTWTGADGSTKCGLNVTVEQVLTAYHVRRKRAAVQGERDANDPAPRRADPPPPRTVPATTSGMAEMSDDIPF